MKIRDKVNAEVKIQHPTLDITEVDLVEFYGPTPNPDQATMRNVVVFGDAQALLNKPGYEEESKAIRARL